MSEIAADAEAQWAEHVAEMAALFDGTKGLFGAPWSELATMEPTAVVVRALKETPEEQRAGFRGQMISISGAREVISVARSRVG